MPFGRAAGERAGLSSRQLNEVIPSAPASLETCTVDIARGALVLQELHRTRHYACSHPELSYSARVLLSPVRAVVVCAERASVVYQSPAILAVVVALKSYRSARLLQQPVRFNSFSCWTLFPYLLQSCVVP